MRNPNSFYLVALCCLLLAACGSAPEKKNPLAAQAVTRSVRGEMAYMRGDYESALHEYGMALRAHLALEQVDGIAITRINLASVWRELGQLNQAHAQLAALFAPPKLIYSSERLAAAATMQSRLYLEEGQTGLAEQWLVRGEEHCQSRCEIAASLYLLRAQLALREQHLVEARRLVDLATKGLQGPSQRIELANAQRLSGDIYLAENDVERAIVQFESALQLDQTIGLPAKIKLDLLRLSQAAQQAGKVEASSNYAARAESVNRAIGAPVTSTSVHP